MEEAAAPVSIFIFWSPGHLLISSFYLFFIINEEGVPERASAVNGAKFRSLIYVCAWLYV